MGNRSVQEVRVRGRTGWEERGAVIIPKPGGECVLCLHFGQGRVCQMEALKLQTL